MRKLKLFFACLLMAVLSIGQVWGGTYFSDSFSNVGTGSSGSILPRNGWSGSGTTAPQYNTGVRIGASSSGATLTKTAMSNIEGTKSLKVTIYVSRYNTNANTLTVTATNGTIASATLAENVSTGSGLTDGTLTIKPSANAGVTSTTAAATWTNAYKTEFTITGASSSTTITFSSSSRLILGPITIEDAPAACSNTVTITKGAETNGTYALSATSVCGDGDGEDVTISNITPATGYTFDEITTSASGTVDNVNKKVTGITAATTITCKFKSLPKYTVSFNVGGSTASQADITEASAGAGITLPTGPTPTCTGWTFAGWKETAAINVETTTAPTLLAAGTNYKPAANCTLYAVYKRTESGAVTDQDVTETFENQEAGTDYQNTLTYTAANSNAGIAWEMYYGTVSTNDKIADTKSAQMRWYSSAKSNIPYIKTTSAVSGLQSVNFKARVSNTAVKMSLWYSTDGTNWTISDVNQETFTATGTAYDFSATISGTVGTNYYIKIGEDGGTAPSSGNYKLIIDAVQFNYKAAASTTYYLSTPTCSCTTLDAPTVSVPDGDLTHNSAKLTWDANNHAEKYIVKFNGEDHETTNAYYEATGLTPETNYTYQVKAVVADGQSDWCSSDFSAEGNFTTKSAPTAHLTLIDIDGTHASSGDYAVGTPFNLPATAAACSKTFYGWTATENYSSETVAPQYKAGESFTFANTTGVTLYAVYADASAGSSYEKTAFASLSNGDEVIVTENDGVSEYAMSNNTGTAKDGPEAVEVTVSEDAISSAQNKILWNISKDENNFTLYPKGSTTTWLYCTNSNDGVRVGTGDAKVFTINDGYIYTSATDDPRYVGMYNQANFRCYTTINSNISGQTLAFYKRATNYSNYSTSCDPLPATLESIAISGTASVLEYTDGQDFAPTGLVVTGHYSDNSDAEITEGITWAFDPSPLTQGTTSVSVTATVSEISSSAFVVNGLTVSAAAPTTDNVVILATFGTKLYAMTNTPGSDNKSLVPVEVEEDGSNIVVASAADKAAIQWTKTTTGTVITFQDANDKYLKGASDGGDLTLSNDECEWTWYESANYNCYAVNDRSFIYRASTYNIFKNYKISNVTPSSTEYAGVEVRVIDPANIVITSKVSAELAYNPASDEITQGDSWSAPTLVNPHSVTITSYASDNESVATVEGGVIALAGGTGTANITAHFAGDASYLEGDAVYTIIVNAPAPVPTGTSYAKVTSTDDITADGEYLLVYETASKAFNGDLATLDGENNTVDVVISEGKIAGTSAIDAAIFTIDATTGDLRSHSGHYVGVGSYGNGMTQSDEAGTYANVFAINTSENVDITITFAGGDMHLLYNTGGRFRYYKAENQTNKAIQLYKKETPEYETVRSSLEINRYYTVCLPKKVIAIKGASLWTLNTKSTDGSQAYLEEETNHLPFAAGKPFIIQATANKLEVVYEGDETTTAGVNGAIHGTLTYMNAAALAAAGSDVYMLYQNELRPVGENNHLDANRAYVILSELTPVSEAEAPHSAPGKRVKSMPMQPQVATGMDELNASEQPVKLMINGQLFILRGEKLYDATGRLVK